MVPSTVWTVYTVIFKTPSFLKHRHFYVLTVRTVNRTVITQNCYDVVIAQPWYDCMTNLLTFLQNATLLLTVNWKTCCTSCFCRDCRVLSKDDSAQAFTLAPSTLKRKRSPRHDRNQHSPGVCAINDKTCAWCAPIKRHLAVRKPNCYLIFRLIQQHVPLFDIRTQGASEALLARAAVRFRLTPAGTHTRSHLVRDKQKQQQRKRSKCGLPYASGSHLQGHIRGHTH